MSVVIAKQKTKIGILFEVSIGDLGPASVRAGYEELRQRIDAYNKALAKDRNIVVQDSYVTTNVNEVLRIQSADATDKRLADVKDNGNGFVGNGRVKVASAEEAPKRKAKAAPEPAAEPVDDDPPHIKTMTPEEFQAAKAEKSKEAQVQTVLPPPVEDKPVKAAPAPAQAGDDLLDKALGKLERVTPNARALLEVLVKSKGPLTLDELEAQSKVGKGSINTWLQSAVKKYHLVESAGRGKYQLNRGTLNA